MSATFCLLISYQGLTPLDTCELTTAGREALHVAPAALCLGGLKRWTGPDASTILMEALARFCLLAPTKNKQQSRWTRPPSRVAHTLVPHWDEAKNRFWATSEAELASAYFLNGLGQLTTHLHRSMDLLDAHRAVAFELFVRLRVPQSGRRGQGVRVY